METEEINDPHSTAADQGVELTGSQVSSGQSTSTPSSSSQASNASEPSSAGEPTDRDDESNSSGRKRRFDSTLGSYKTKKMKQKVPTDAQMLHIAEKELEMKERMMDRLETMSKDHREMMSALTNNLKGLSETMTGAFTLLQQSLMQSSHASSQAPPYYSPYPYAPPPPSPTLPVSRPMYHQPHHISATPSPQATSSERYSPELFEDT